MEAHGQLSPPPPASSLFLLGIFALVCLSFCSPVLRIHHILSVTSNLLLWEYVEFYDAQDQIDCDNAEASDIARG